MAFVQDIKTSIGECDGLAQVAPLVHDANGIIYRHYLTFGSIVDAHTYSFY